MIPPAAWKSRKIILDSLPHLAYFNPLMFFTFNQKRMKDDAFRNSR
jgi:hypothetical protein